MNYLNRQQGIKRAKRVIRANPNWKHSFKILVRTRKPCSCYMCGHRRQLLGRTRQEQIFSIDEEMRAWEALGIQDWIEFERKLEQ